MHVQGCVVPRCEMCCERGTRESQSAETGGYQYLCMFLSPPRSILVSGYKSPCLSSPQDERNILFLPDFPTQAGFLEGEGWGKVKT